MRKALVIGGNGFIGSHLVDHLVSRSWDVTVLDIQDRRYDPQPQGAHFIRGDLTQSYVVREALVDIETVFHLAWATIHEISNQDPAADVVANLVPSIHLLELCRQARVQRLVFVSSGGTIYGPTQALPIPETHPTNPVNAYGISKLAVEKYIRMFHHLYGMEYAILRPSVPYGPRQNPLGRQGAASVFLYRIGHGLPVKIWGDGQVTRDYFYISDLISALIASAEGEFSGDPLFNLGGQEEVSLLRLVEAVEHVVGKDAMLEFEPARKFDVPRLLLSKDRAAEVLNWTPRVGLEEGLEQTWDWISTTIP